MKTAVCDDEKIYRDTVVHFLRQYAEEGSVSSITEFESGEELIENCRSGSSYDLIFLDVEMGGMTGVEAAQLIREFDANAMIIFVTSHQQYVPEAFMVNAFQFLVKPISEDIFKREFCRALELYNKKRFKYKITYKEKTILLEAKDILYIETYNRHLRAVTTRGDYEYTGNMSAEEKKFLPYNFVRCHQSYLLNMHFINNLDKSSFILTNGQAVPISKHLKAGVLLKFNRFVSGCCL